MEEYQVVDYRNRESREKNVISSLLHQIVVFSCGLIVPRLMIIAFGSEACGAVSSITNFLTYITILECGISNVARSAIYKPILDNDWCEVSTILIEIRCFFIKLFKIFIVYSLILASCYKFISNFNYMDWLTSFLLVLVVAISVLCQYYLGIPYEVLLNADQKKYVINVASLVTILLNAVSTLILVQMGYGLMFVKMIGSIIFLMRPLMLYLYIRKFYNLIYNGNCTRKSSFFNRWNATGQHIASFLHNNVDIAVLTFIVDLRMVAVYTIYSMITYAIQVLSLSFISGVESVFGNLLVRNDILSLKNKFNKYEDVISIAAVILFSVTFVLIVPFVKLYTQGIVDADYEQPLFAFVMVLNGLLYCIRLPYHSMIMAAGHFRETNNAVYGEAIINLFLSVLLSLKYGLIGVSVATFVALSFRFIYYVFYLSDNILYRNKILFFRRLTINVGCVCANLFLGNYVITCFDIVDFGIWMRCGFCLFILITISTTVINKLCSKFNFNCIA